MPGSWCDYRTDRVPSGFGSHLELGGRAVTLGERSVLLGDASSQATKLLSWSVARRRHRDRARTRDAIARRDRSAGARTFCFVPAVQVACGAMSDRIESIPKAYRGVMIASTPGVVWWGRLQVTGLELLPLEGPLLLVGDHDSYWDTVAAGIAAAPRRQIRALAKSSMWKNKLLGAVLTGMGQVPIERGSGDSGALDRAIEELRNGACIGIYPEGTRSLGRALRARSGVGYLARAVPEATIIGGSCNGTVAIPRFPRARPQVRVEFFEFDRPAIAPEESPQQYSTRLLAQIRQRAPIEVAGRKRAGALAGRVPTWSPELAITGKPGGEGALEEALAQTAPKHG